jgi:hypothetical protein
MGNLWRCHTLNEGHKSAKFIIGDNVLTFSGNQTGDNVFSLVPLAICAHLLKQTISKTLD